MGHRGIILCAVALCASACMETNTEIRALPPLAQQAIVPGAEQASPVAADFVVADGVARGRLSWASTCRRVVLLRERSQKVTRTKPSYGAAVATGVIGLGAGATGVAALSSRDHYSREVTCEEDTDYYDDEPPDCSSPRGRITELGIVLVGSALALTAVAIATVASPPSNRFRDAPVGPPREARVLAEGVPCGDGPVAGLEVALYRSDQLIAASTTDGDGGVAFSVPRWITGPARLVADTRSSRYAIIVPGQELGEIVLEPMAIPGVRGGD